LEADGVQLQYGEWKILSDIYIKCETGSVTGLLGRNGMGKTTLMNIIYGSRKAQSQSVRADGLRVPCAFQVPQLVAYLPQFNFIPNGLNIKRIFADFQVPFDLLVESLPELGDRYQAKFDELSGGQKRLVEIFLVLKTPGRFALLDEPFSMLSPLWIELVKSWIKEGKQYKGILLTDHLYHEVMFVSDQLYVLTNGKTHFINDRSEVEWLGYAKFS
jgi:ABC-type multidrug transport system ATPase subunit